VDEARTTTDECVVAIVTHKPTLSPWERISLRQCDRVLHRYDLVLVCPRDMDVSAYLDVVPRLEVLRIRRRWLDTYERFSHLKLSPLLYRSFRRYRYVLFYELDAFVFRDELRQWCDAGFDYVGAPWFSGRPDYGDDSVVIGAGNGGFSLRNVESHLRANRVVRYLTPPRALWREYRRHTSGGRMRAFVSFLVKLAGIGNSTWYYLRAPLYHLGRNVPAEDLFWTERMAPALGWFEVADANVARRFSFEILPRRLYEMNGCRLPFGCHGWYRFDPEFWRPFVAAEGYELPATAPPRHHDSAV